AEVYAVGSEAPNDPLAGGERKGSVATRGHIDHVYGESLRPLSVVDVCITRTVRRERARHPAMRGRVVGCGQGSVENRLRQRLRERPLRREACTGGVNHPAVSDVQEL